MQQELLSAQHAGRRGGGGAGLRNALRARGRPGLREPRLVLLSAPAGLGPERSCSALGNASARPNDRSAGRDPESETRFPVWFTQSLDENLLLCSFGSVGKAATRDGLPKLPRRPRLRSNVLGPRPVGLTARPFSPGGYFDVGLFIKCLSRRTKDISKNFWPDKSSARKVQDLGLVE